MTKLVRDLWSVLTPRQRRRVLAAQLLSILMAFSTVSGIAAIAPFFAVFGQPGLIEHNAVLHWAYVHGGFSSKRGLVVALGIAFIAVMLIANLINVLGRPGDGPPGAADRHRAAIHLVRGIPLAPVILFTSARTARRSSTHTL